MSKLLMVASSLTLGAAGLAASFAPVEILSAFGLPSSSSVAILVQLLGALYFASAMANWMAKDSMIGGIYARPLSLGNFTHFLIGSLALAKFQAQRPIEPWLLSACVLYILFAIGFARLLMVTPRRVSKAIERRREDEP